MIIKLRPFETSGVPILAAAFTMGLVPLQSPDLDPSDPATTMVYQLMGTPKKGAINFWDGKLTVLTDGDGYFVGAFLDYLNDHVWHSRMNDYFAIGQIEDGYGGVEEFLSPEDTWLLFRAIRLTVEDQDIIHAALRAWDGQQRDRI